MKKVFFISFYVLFLLSCSYDSGRALKQSTAFLFETNVHGEGVGLQIEFVKGSTFNNPLMAFWVEDVEGGYVQTLYAAESIAKGYFKHGDRSSGKWLPGPIRRPAALPYWAHKRNVREDDGLLVPKPETALPDAITGATPKENFILKTKTDDKKYRQFKLMFEINQSWDWNNYWHNDKYPNDNDYKSSSQPALVYEVVIDLDNPKKEYELKVIGHSHYSGRTGELFTDLSTITTALNIVNSVKVRVIK